MIIEMRAMGPIESNCYIVAEREGGPGVVIDPCWDDPWITESIARLGLEVDLILNTHGHFDHVCGIPRVKRATGARFFLHQADVELVQAAPDYAAILAGESVEPPPPPDGYLHDGEVYKVGALEFVVLETPGHSQGGVCFRVGDTALFSGDTLFAGSIGRTDNPEGNQAQLLQSIHEKLLPLPDAMAVYPGHGEPTTIGRERQHNPFLRA